MKYVSNYKFGPMRYLEAIVMADVLKPITSINTNLETKLFFQIFLSIIETHHQAYEVTGLLHRDIHTNNLMWKIVDGQPVGMLIDWDFSNRFHPHPFLAVDLLEKEPHPRLYRHDLESFFWVLWTIVLTRADVAGLDEFVKVSRWEQGDLNERKTWKMAFLDRGHEAVVRRLKESTKTGLSHPSVVECLLRLSHLISDGQDALRLQANRRRLAIASMVCGTLVVGEWIGERTRADIPAAQI
ncbi:uncharacterized protein EI90DRAFT_3050879, partial [Cantharellus anzutake]|uniref:uncharacterized protein n=1 Tax=Cantharellus anzutake TaxID=1750568 RepID=UPI001905F881